MRFSAVSLTLAALVASVFAVDPLVVNTPAISRQCEATVATWNGGVAPFNLFFKFDGISEDRHGITERTNSWNTNVPSGTAVTLEVHDAEGAVAQSATWVVQPSTVTACL